MGRRLKGIRIDSGDLAYLSVQVRKMLDEAGLDDCKIIVSNSLDEYTITSILNQGGKIDSFGVGERLITAKSDPVFGAVYKIAAVESIAPEVRGMSERAFFLLVEKVFSLPEVAALVSHATDQQEDG